MKTHTLTNIKVKEMQKKHNHKSTLTYSGIRVKYERKIIPTLYLFAHETKKFPPAAPVQPAPIRDHKTSSGRRAAKPHPDDDGISRSKHRAQRPHGPRRNLANGRINP